MLFSANGYLPTPHLRVCPETFVKLSARTTPPRSSAYCCLSSPFLRCVRLLNAHPKPRPPAIHHRPQREKGEPGVAASLGLQVTDGRAPGVTNALAGFPVAAAVVAGGVADSAGVGAGASILKVRLGG